MPPQATTSVNLQSSEIKYGSQTVYIGQIALDDQNNPYPYGNGIIVFDQSGVNEERAIISIQGNFSNKTLKNNFAIIAYSNHDIYSGGVINLATDSSICADVLPHGEGIITCKNDAANIKTISTTFDKGEIVGTVQAVINFTDGRIFSGDISLDKNRKIHLLEGNIIYANGDTATKERDANNPENFIIRKNDSRSQSIKQGEVRSQATFLLKYDEEEELRRNSSVEDPLITPATSVTPVNAKAVAAARQNANQRNSGCVIS